VLPDPISEAREAAQAAFVEAATLGLNRTEAFDVAFDAAMAALREHEALRDGGHPAPTAEQLDRTAQELAIASDFPAYTDADGWKLLRRYQHHIACAYRKATERLFPGQEGLARELTLAQERLLEHLKADSACQTPPDGEKGYAGPDNFTNDNGGELTTRGGNPSVQQAAAGRTEKGKWVSLPVSSPSGDHEESEKNK